MKRLTLITNTLTSFGGGEKWSLEVAVRLKKKFKITLASPTSSSSVHRRTLQEIAEQYDLDGIELAEFESLGLSTSAFGRDKYTMMLPKPKGISRLSEVIKASDVIYMVSFNPLFLSMVIALAKAHKKRLILGVHNPTFYKLFEKGAGIRQRGMNRLFISAMRRIKCFHVLTGEDKKLVESKFPGARACLIPIFITHKRMKASVNRKDFIALLVGRLETSQKGIDLLSKIVNSTVSKNRNVVFHVVGKGGDGEQTVMGLSRKLRKNFVWLGFIDDDKLSGEYRNASAILSTSRYETFPAALLEGQSYGLPAVTFRIKGASTIISEGFQGKMVKQFETGQFSDSILEYYRKWGSSRKQYLAQKERIIKSAYGRFGDKRIIRQMQKLFDGKPG